MVVIIGGGIIGSLCGWFLREQGYAGAITVVERDPSYRFASTALSAASIRTQFGCAVNVELSLYGMAFLKSLQARWPQDADIGLVENGYLILSGPADAEARLGAMKMQARHGADVEALDQTELASRFPWLNATDIALATFGRSGEGWFDAWSLLQGARRAAVARSVVFRRGDAVGLRSSGDRVSAVELADGSVLAADWCVNAAGALSGRVAGWLGVNLPVAPRKRTIFNFEAPLPSAALPMLFDVSGAWMRPEGAGFIAGIQPDADSDAYDDFEPDHDLFEGRLWPILAARVPALERLRLKCSWAGHYEMNLLDHNGVVGPLSEGSNFLFATGFSGHGVMHAPGVARAIAEWVVGGRYQSLDLSPLGFQRIREGRPLPETAIY